MKTKVLMRLVVVVLLAVVNIARADTFGTGANQFTIDFVNIYNAGNAGDSTGYGAVSYNYSIGKYEITNSQWDAFVSAAGVPIGNPSDAYDRSAYYTGAQLPTNSVSWYESIQFCNYLTSGNKSEGAYLFSGDKADAGDFLGIDRDSAVSTYGTVYVLPTQDEWYKAAYYKPDDSGYSLYANGQSTIAEADNGWNYYGGSYSEPWNVSTGTEEQNGTFDMMGNVSEWTETISISSFRGIRGGSISNNGNELSSANWYNYSPADEVGTLGFRVASVPEPATLLLLGLGGLALLRKRRV